MKKKINFIEKINLDNQRPVYLYLKLFFFLILIFVQEIVLTSFIQAYKLDILTPCFTYYIITRSRLRSFFIIMISTLNLELITTAPKGFYICFWLMIAQIIFHIKDHLTWKKSFTWYFITILITLCIVFLERLIQFYFHPFVLTSNLHFYSLIFVRILTCLILSSLLYRKLSSELTKEKFA